MPKSLSPEARAALQAGRLLRRTQVDENRQIPVFELIASEGLELMFRPLDRLLGAYLPASNGWPAGVLVSANLPRALQRFTAAHELGHHTLSHGAVTDDESQIDSPSSMIEREADAFAERLLMPEELVRESIRKLQLGGPLRDFEDAYQLSLELGASYRATVKRLRTLRYLSPSVANVWFTRAPRDAKARIAPQDVVENYRRDALILTPDDQRTEIYLRQGDVIAVEVTESPTTGYLWEVEGSGPVRRLAERVVEEEKRYGSEVRRRVLFTVDAPGEAELGMELRRPWLKDSTVRAHRVLVHGEAVPLGPLLSVA